MHESGIGAGSNESLRLANLVVTEAAPHIPIGGASYGLSHENRECGAAGMRGGLTIELE